MKPSFDDAQTCYYNYAKNYCNRTPTVKVIVENVVTCFFWDTEYTYRRSPRSFRRIGVFGVELLNNINPDIILKDLIEQ